MQAGYASVEEKFTLMIIMMLLFVCGLFIKHVIFLGFFCRWIWSRNWENQWS